MNKLDAILEIKMTLRQAVLLVGGVRAAITASGKAPPKDLDDGMNAVWAAVKQVVSTEGLKRLLREEVDRYRPGT
jgi:hypothetical protein